MNENYGKKIWWYIWRSMLLLAYVIGGLLGFLWMILWNHGFFGDGADVLPVLFEIALFIIWIIAGVVGLFILSKKSVKKCFLVIFWAAVALGIFVACRYISEVLLPDMDARKEVNDIKESAEDLCDVPVDYIYITFYLDTDEEQLHYWNHSGEEPKHYDTIKTFSVKKVDKEFSDLNQSLVMYKLTSEDGEIYCLSGPKYYREIEEMYWLYNGQMYYADVENVIWSEGEAELWKQNKEEYYNKKKGK